MVRRACSIWGGRPRLILARLANHRSTNTNTGSGRFASCTVARTPPQLQDGRYWDWLTWTPARHLFYFAPQTFCFSLAFVCPRTACGLFTGHDNGTHPSPTTIAKIRVTRCTIVLETLGYASHVAKDKGHACISHAHGPLVSNALEHERTNHPVAWRHCGGFSLLSSFPVAAAGWAPRFWRNVSHSRDLTFRFSFF